MGPRSRSLAPPPRGHDAWVSGNVVSLLSDGPAAFPAMLAAIGAARREILLEMYWFASDATGRRFADALVERARAGVQVRVLYDAVGSIETDPRLFLRLRDAGCDVAAFNPIAPWRTRFRLGVVNRRDHRKLLVVDERVGFTGGVNLADAWAGVDQGGKGWRDDVVRVEGPAAAQLAAVFFTSWSRRAEGWFGDHYVSAPRPLAGELRFDDSPGPGEDVAAVASPEAPPLASAGDTDTPRARSDEAPVPSTTDAPVHVLASDWHLAGPAIRRAYLRRIREASERISLTNAYFVPDRPIRRELIRAVRRGVNVRVMVPGRSDVPAVHYAGRSLYEELLDGGVRIFEWSGSMLHAKTAVIDRRWCTVGTYNLDYRSLRFNLELTMVIDDPTFGAVMARRFDADLEHARPLLLDRWRRRPTLERGLETLAYRMRKLL